MNTEHNPRSTPIFWLIVAIAAHAGWGAYPVLGRHLQTASQLPTFSLLAMGNFLAMVLVGVLIWPNLDKGFLRQPGVWLFGAAVALRGTTNLLAVRYTLAVYVQLITQMTPFIVALLSVAVLRDPLPKYIGRAIVVCTIGAALMLSGDFGQATAGTAVRNDWIGIPIAIASSGILAVYMLMIRRTSDHYRLGGGELMVIHVISLFSFAVIASLLAQEDLSQWGQIGVWDWALVFIFGAGVVFFANWGQIQAIRHLGAPLASSFMAVRLISAIAIGALLLGERPQTIWQVIGGIMVLFMLTWYLRKQAQ